MFVIIILLPLCVILSSCFGYTFELTDYSVFAIITAILSVCTTVLHIISKKTIESETSKVLFALLTPLSLENTFFYIFKCDNVTIWIAICMAICTVCSCCLTAKHGKPLTLKIICFVLSALSVLPTVFFGLMANIGQNTVIQSVESPNDTYYAKVIDSNQGALGGNTLVDVYESRIIDAGIFKIQKKPQLIYRGEWGEFEDMEIYWKNENSLIINSVEYTIEQ
ncbi:MAG: hypothetical protein IJZ35_09220 [Clostridia bacterium]|nr:hypothetical protein [Clostridia bacterium]